MAHGELSWLPKHAQGSHAILHPHPGHTCREGHPLPLSGMKTSTGLLKGPTPPLVTAATRTEHVALVATTGRRAVLLFCWASEEMFCWRREETSLGLTSLARQE